MSQLFVKIRLQKNGNKYRKLLATEKNIFPGISDLVLGSVEYDPQTLLDEGEWYFVNNFSRSEYAAPDLLNPFDTVEFDSLEVENIKKIDFLFAEEEGVLFFQNIGSSRLVQRKTLLHFGGNFCYDDKCMSIIIHEIPDAAYIRESDTLYFRKLASITGIFKGMDLLYREATEDETEHFLQNTFLSLKDGFSAVKVKTANRKRIALATDTLSQLKQSEQKQIFHYIKEYCPHLKYTNHAFEITNEDDLKMLLYGIEQRFYTTLIGKEKRIANSVITLK